MLERATEDPTVRTTAGSALVPGGALTVANAVPDHTGDRPRQHGYRFDAGETPADGIGRIARTELDLTIDLINGISAPDESGAAVHEARKALKRLRALLRVSRPTIDERRYRDENRVLRDVGRALSGTRDAQVLLDTLDALGARYDEALRKGTWSRLRASLASATARSDGIVGAEKTGPLLGTLSEARSRVATWQLPQNGRPDSLAGGFAAVYQRGRRACRAANSTPSTEALHELRKRAKDLWHGAQLLEPIGAPQLKDLKQSAHRLSDLLGEDHDLTILRDHAQAHPELVSEVGLELLTVLTRSRQEALRREALSCAAELYRDKPKRLLRRLALA